MEWNPRGACWGSEVRGQVDRNYWSRNFLEAPKGMYLTRASPGASHFGTQRTSAPAELGPGAACTGDPGNAPMPTAPPLARQPFLYPEGSRIWATVHAVGKPCLGTKGPSEPRTVGRNNSRVKVPRPGPDLLLLS